MLLWTFTYALFFKSTQMFQFSWTCCCSVTKSCPIICNPMDCSMPLVYPLLSPRVCSNSCSLSQWCYLTISSSATPFSFCLQSFPASFWGSFPVSQLFVSGCQNLELQLQHQSFQMVCWGCFLSGLTKLTIQKIILYLTFWGSGKLFSKMALMFYIPT